MKHLDQKHPSESAWMEYLYDEMDSAERRTLEAHLEICSPCRVKRETFRGTQQSLDHWNVETPSRHEFAPRWQPVVKWAAAAVLLVSTAFATGRMSRPSIDVESLQAKIATPLKEQLALQLRSASEEANVAMEAKLRAEFAMKLREVSEKTLAEATANVKKQVEELSLAINALREQDKSSLASTLEEYQNQRLAEYMEFRADLERVALFSQSVAQFASYSENEPPVLEPEN